MKKMWISILLLLVLLGGCIIGAVAVDSFSKKTISHLEQAVQSAKQDDFDSVRNECNHAANIWKSNASLLGALLRHSEADVVEAQLMQLISYSETEDKDEFLALCAELIHNIRHVRDMEYPLLRNIL